jgi:superoxide dismutase, Fe-Mn family
MLYTLPELSYPFDALEPHIDAKTMEIHHGKHHACYVANLNKALEGHDVGQPTIEELLADLDTLPEDVRTVVRNNGGGHANHSLFWTILSKKGGGEPRGEFGRVLDKDFGGFDRFIEEITKAAVGRFGAGWAWLSVNPRGRLLIESSANQDSPLMSGRTPIFGIDVWEHAYYLKYQNRRADYIKALWNVVDWNVVTERYLEAVRRAEMVQGSRSV